MSDKLTAPKIIWMVHPTFDDDGVQRSAGIDQFGREHGDPVPMSPPIGLSVSQGDELHAQLKKMFQVERERMRIAAEAYDFESEDEANDFMVEEDIFPPGNEPWEDVHELPAEPSPAAGEGGSGPPASQAAPNGQNRAPEDATGQPSPNRTASADSGASLSQASSPGRQTLSAGTPSPGGG